MSQLFRIGIDARFWGREHGGFSTYARGLLHALAEQDKATVYRIFLHPKDVEEWDIRQSNFQPIPAPFTHYSLQEQTGFLSLLRSERLDLVHFLNFNAPLLYLGPFVTTLHDLTVLHSPVGRSQRSWLRRRAFLLALNHGLKGAKRVIAISEFSAKDAEQRLGLPATKVDVVYEGIPELQQLAFGNKAIVQEYFGSRSPYFLFVSQWRPHKGIITLIEAFTRFKQETGLPHKLVLAGKQQVSGELVEAALQACSFRSEVITPGFVPDAMLPNIYKNAAAFIMPSEYEGFGLPVLEAMRYGAPVICADNSALPEIGGAAALYFPTGDSNALSNRMQVIVKDKVLVGRLHDEAAFQLERFSWERCATQTLEVYRHVLEKQGRSAIL